MQERLCDPVHKLVPFISALIGFLHGLNWVYGHREGLGVIWERRLFKFPTSASAALGIQNSRCFWPNNDITARPVEAAAQVESNISSWLHSELFYNRERQPSC